MNLLLGSPGACCSLVLLTIKGTHWPCPSFLSYLGFHSLILTHQNAKLNVLYKETLCRSFKPLRRGIVLLDTCCPKNSWQLQAGVGSLHLSEMCVILPTSQVPGGTGRCTWSARQQSFMLFPFPAFIWAPLSPAGPFSTQQPPLEAAAGINRVHSSAWREPQQDAVLAP